MVDPVRGVRKTRSFSPTSRLRAAAAGRGASLGGGGGRSAVRGVNRTRSFEAPRSLSAESKNGTNNTVRSGGIAPRPPVRKRSFSPSSKVSARSTATTRSRSNSPTSIDGSRNPSRSPSGNGQNSRPRSRSPSGRVADGSGDGWWNKSDEEVERQEQVSRGISRSPVRGVGRTRSFDPSSIARRSGGFGPPQNHDTRRPGRSSSPSSRLSRSTHGDPTTAARRGRSSSPSNKQGGRVRIRSASPSSRMSNVHGRSRSRSPGARSRDGSTDNDGASRSRHKKRRRPRPLKNIGRSFRRRRPGEPGKRGLRDRPGLEKAYRASRRRLAKSKFGRSIRRIAPKEQFPTSKLLYGYALPIVLIIVSTIGLFVSTGNVNRITPDALKDLIPTLNSEDLEDPNSGGNGMRWKNGGNGVEVKIHNALEDDWQVVFSLAIADWDFGIPDALTLITERIEHDVDCINKEGVVKVCNGNYGKVPWRGVNQIVTDKDNFIVSSAARMNEYYVFPEGKDSQQYTMCHEMGHGFGLPHTDENFENEDLGNCMDYTKNFGVNKHPDITNYEYLFNLYGSVGDRRQQRNKRRRRRFLRRRGGGGGSVKFSSSNDEENDMTEDSADISTSDQDFANTTSDDLETTTSRMVGGSVTVKDDSDESIPHHVRQRMEDAFAKLVSRRTLEAEFLDSEGWKLLHRHSMGEAHEMDIGEGYKAQAHFLLA